MIKGIVSGIHSTIISILQKYVGINIDKSMITSQDGNSIKIYLENVSPHPTLINQTLLQKSNIKITKSKIEQLSIQISTSEINIKISGIKLVVMPIQNINKIEIQKEEPKIINNKNEEIPYKNLIDFFLKKLKLQINQIDLFLLNYETNEKNISYANPCLSLHIPNISYNQNENDINSKIDYSNNNENNINLSFTISNIFLCISQTINFDNKYINYNNENSFFSFNPEKPIKLNINFNNGIDIYLGDAQFFINIFQLQLLKNFIECYLPYFISDNNNINNNVNNINNNKEELKIKENKLLLINIDSFSLIFFENSHSNTYDIKEKRYCFQIEKYINNFCFYEEDFYIFYITQIICEIKNNSDLNVEFNNLFFDFVEFIKKDEPINDESISSKNNEFVDLFDSTMFNNYELSQTYTYSYELFEILRISNPKLHLKKNKLNFELHKFFFQLHPAFMFKILKICFDNFLLIKTLLFSKEIDLNNINNEKKKENINDNLNIEMSEDSLNSNNFSNNFSNNSNIINNNQINNQINNQTNNIEINISISSIILIIKVFKPEEEFIYNTITPYFTDFYYDCIYLMEHKENPKEKLLLESITNIDFIEFDISDIKFNQNIKKNETNITIKNINGKFDNSTIINLLDPLLIKTNPSFKNIKINSKINVELNLTYVIEAISFINIWIFTLKIWEIFFKRMFLNYQKNFQELYNQYSENNFTKNEDIISTDESKESNINIQINISLLKVSLKCSKYLCDKFPTLIINQIDVNMDIINNEIKLDTSINRIFIDNLVDIFYINDITFKLIMNDNIDENIKKSLYYNKRLYKKEFMKIIPNREMERYLKEISNLENKKLNKTETQMNIDIKVGKTLIKLIEILNLAESVYNSLQNINNYRMMNKEEKLKLEVNSFFNSQKSEIKEINISNSSNDSNEIKEIQLFILDTSKFKFNVKIEEIDIIIDIKNLEYKLITELSKISLNNTEYCLNDLKIYFQLNKKEGLETLIFNSELLNIHLIKLSLDKFILFTLDSLSISFCKDSFSELFEYINIITDLIKSKSFCQNDPKELHEELKIYTETYDDNETSIINNILQSTNVKIKDKKNLSSIENNSIFIQIGTIKFKLYVGNDFKMHKNIDFLNNYQIDGFEVVDNTKYVYETNRNLNQYICLILSNINLIKEYEDGQYKFQFSIKNFEIYNQLECSIIKKLLGRVNLENVETESWLKINVDVSTLNNFNQSKDMYINSEINIIPLNIILDENTLLFLIDFFTVNENNSKKNIKFIKTKSEISNSDLNDNKSEGNISQSIFIRKDSYFTDIKISNSSKSSNKSICKINTFFLHEFFVNISFNSNSIYIIINGMYIPITTLKDYKIEINQILIENINSDTFIEKFTEIFINNISKYEIIKNLLSSLSFIQPLVNIISNFFNIFISPYKSYKDKKGVTVGLIKGLKLFFSSFIGNMVLISEKTIRGMTSFIGITQTNHNFDKNSFYSKYFLTDEQKWFNEHYLK